MSRLQTWLRSLTHSQLTALLVLMAHALLLLILLWDHAKTPSSPLAKPMRVRTSFLPRQPFSFSQAPAKQAAAQSKRVRPAEAPRTQKRTTQPPLPAKEKERSASRGHTPSIDPALLEEIAAAIEPVKEQNPSCLAPFAAAIPQIIAMHTINESSVGLNTPAYGDAVAAVLQNALDLPELGEVVARIEIDAGGRIVSCEILEERSRKNSDFLRKRLQEVIFPCFNQFQIFEDRLTFTITFRNL